MAQFSLSRARLGAISFQHLHLNLLLRTQGTIIVSRTDLKSRRLQLLMATKGKVGPWRQPNTL